MAGPLYYDRCLETSVTTGTGTYTLAGAVAGYQSFAAVGDTNTCYYCAFEVDANGNANGGWEVGLGTYTSSGTTLARTAILASTNSNNAVSWGAGTRRVALVQPAAAMLSAIAANTITVTNTGTATYATPLTLIHALSSGTAAVGMGVALDFKSPDAGGTLVQQATILTEFAVATAGATNRSTGTLRGYRGGSSFNCFKWGPTSGGATGVGFHNGDPVGVQTGDIGDALVAYALMSGTPTFAAANITNANIAAGGRLSLTSGTPATTADVTGATNVYYTPYINNVISLWDGTYWKQITFTEQTLALGTVTSGLPYDVFGYISSSVLAVEKLAWTNGTTRATAITLQDGRYCKSGDKTRLYLGTFYTTSTTATEDSASKRYVWNMYNRCRRSMKAVDATNTWAYSTSTLRQANNNTANKVEFVRGLDDDAVSASVVAGATTSPSATRAVSVSIGLDSTSAKSADCVSGLGLAATNSGVATARYAGFPGVGYHYLAWLEWAAGGGDTQTWYGDNGGSVFQSGLVAEVWA